MRSLVLYIVAPLLLALSFAVITPAVHAAGSAKDQACTAVNSLQGNNGDSCDSSDGPSIQKLVRLSLEMLSIAAGVIAVIMLIIAGLNYMTAAGDATKVSHGKSTLIYAIVGLVVVAFAQFIVRFVLARAG